MRPRFRVEHIGLAASDPRRLADWYVKMLDAELVYQTDTSPVACFILLPGGLLIELYAAATSVAETANNRLAGWRHLAIKTDSIELGRNLLEARGVVFTEAPKPAGGGGRVLFFADLEGNLLHLVERPPDSPLKRMPRRQSRAA